MNGRKNQKDTKKSNWFYWVCGIILCIVFWPVASVLIGLALGIMVAKGMISASGKSDGPQKYLEGRRKEMGLDMQQWQAKQELREKQRSAAFAELEELKKQAYWWDGKARETGSAADARKAQACWNQVDSARRKLDSI